MQIHVEKESFTISTWSLIYVINDIPLKYFHILINPTITDRS